METHDVTTKGIGNKDFKYTFECTKSPKEIFEFLLGINNWWNGLFEETISGKSQALHDEFSFKAGGGMHYSKQKLIKLVPYENITWQVTESTLSFLNNTEEWVGTKIRFDLTKENNNTKIAFTHEGLVPQFECYDSCSNAWTNYMEKLEVSLK